MIERRVITARPTDGPGRAVGHLAYRSIPMPYDHSTTAIHRADLDREIEGIRNERLIAAGNARRRSVARRIRRSVGRLLVAVGTAMIGRESSTLRTHRA